MHPEENPPIVPPASAFSEPAKGRKLPLGEIVRRGLALLFLTLAWGGNWPIAKLGVAAMPPLWFRFIGTFGGVLVLYLYTRLMGISLSVPRGARLRIVILAIPNMVLWYSLVTVALVILPAGRAAILGFTMPTWAALLGFATGQERPDRWSLLGVACGLAAALLLVAATPGLTGQPLAVAMMLLAAMSWALGTQLLRRWPMDMDTAALTFWMLLVTAIALFALSAMFEAARWGWPNREAFWAIGYSAIIVVGLGNIAWFALARRLPPVISGLSSMLIPVVGVFMSMAMVHEQPTPWDWWALALVALALLSTVVPRPRR